MTSGAWLKWLTVFARHLDRNSLFEQDKTNFLLNTKYNFTPTLMAFICVKFQYKSKCSYDTGQTNQKYNLNAASFSFLEYLLFAFTFIHVNL